MASLPQDSRLYPRIRIGMDTQSAETAITSRRSLAVVLLVGLILGTIVAPTLAQGRRQRTALRRPPRFAPSVARIDPVEQVQAGDHEEATQLLGLALSHPACDDRTALDAQPVLAARRGAPPARQPEAELARGAKLDLEQVVTESLREALPGG